MFLQFVILPIVFTKIQKNLLKFRERGMRVVLLLFSLCLFVTGTKGTGKISLKNEWGQF